ncbi:MAG TPA: SDR family oxidoreductase [Ktedonobacteraceae bacterium]|nr:SDR family oxidoreductase [Ktedonobacteraceae bacterium]
MTDPHVSFDLSGKVALITGASRGIGEAIAIAYAQAGANIVIASRKLEGLQQVATKIEALGGKVLPVVANVGEDEQLEALVDKTRAQFGGIDILVNNAAINPAFGPLLSLEDRTIEKIFRVNVFGYIKLARLCVPSMRERGGGKIINMSSVGGLRPGRGLGAYSMSKAAVISLTKGLAQELGPDNIQVNAIAPGIIKTKFAAFLVETESIAAPALAGTPLGRFGEPQDVAGVALFLASPASNYITGTVNVIDGGGTLGGGVG